jgi:hypothetical protein
VSDLGRVFPAPGTSPPKDGDSRPIKGLGKLDAGWLISRYFRYSPGTWVVLLLLLGVSLDQRGLVRVRGLGTWWIRNDVACLSVSASALEGLASPELREKKPRKTDDYELNGSCQSKTFESPKPPLIQLTCQLWKPDIPCLEQCAIHMHASVFTLSRWDAMSLFSPGPDRLVLVLCSCSSPCYSCCAVSCRRCCSLATPLPIPLRIRDNGNEASNSNP